MDVISLLVQDASCPHLSFQKGDLSPFLPTPFAAVGQFPITRTMRRCSYHALLGRVIGADAVTIQNLSRLLPFPHHLEVSDGQ
jgi:hypothetical protein